MLYAKLIAAALLVGIVGFFVYDYNASKKQISILEVSIQSQQRMLENQFDTILAIEDALDVLQKSKDDVRENKQVRTENTTKTVKKLVDSTPDMFEKNLNESLQGILK